jgi:hypothetical protein
MDRTWELLTKAASSREERVRGQIDAQRDSGHRSGPFARLVLDEDGCSCHPGEVAVAGNDGWRTSTL